MAPVGAGKPPGKGKRPCASACRHGPQPTRMLSAAYKPWSGLHANWRNHLSRRQGSTCHWEARVSGTFSQATQPVVADRGLLKSRQIEHKDCSWANCVHAHSSTSEKPWSQTGLRLPSGGKVIPGESEHPAILAGHCRTNSCTTPTPCRTNSCVEWVGH